MLPEITKGGLRVFTELRKLTPVIVNTLIRRIEVHNSDRSDGHKRVKADAYFTAIGMFDPRYKFRLTA